MKWIIDSYDVVHVSKHCESVVDDPGHEGRKVLLYVTTPQTVEEMIVHLARPDRTDMGRHEGKTPLVPCDQCLLDLPLEQ